MSFGADTGRGRRTARSLLKIPSSFIFFAPRPRRGLAGIAGSTALRAVGFELPDPVLPEPNRCFVHRSRLDPRAMRRWKRSMLSVC